jgi:hypothetical protein
MNFSSAVEGQLPEVVGTELNDMLQKMFSATKTVGPGQIRPPPLPERKSIKDFVQVTQKLFFNPRVPNYTGILC